MKSTSILIVFLLFSILSWSQDVNIKTLKFKDFYRGSEPSFVTCNPNEDFFIRDSFELTTHSFDCCKTFEFKIRNKRIYEIEEVRTCTEPPRLLLTKEKRWGKIKKRKSDYYIIIFEGKTQLIIMKIIELKEVKHIDNYGLIQKDYFMNLTRVK
jgi:hypothetical protein